MDESTIIALHEIANAIGTIGAWTAGMDLDDFREYPTVAEAVSDKVLSISHAAIRLGGAAESWCPGIQWREIRGLGNWLSQEHEWAWLRAVWHTVRVDLPPLRAAIARALLTKRP